MHALTISGLEFCSSPFFPALIEEEFGEEDIRVVFAADIANDGSEISYLKYVRFSEE